MLRSTLILLFFIPFIGSSQYYVGPELGANVIQMNTSELGRDFQLGWFGGVTGEYRFNKWISLRTGIHISQAKHSYSSSDTSVLELLDGIVDSSLAIPGIDLNTYTDVEGVQQAMYIQVPVQARFQWKGLSLAAGPYVGFLVTGLQREVVTERSPALDNIDLSGLDPTGGLFSSFIPPAYQQTSSRTRGTDGLRFFDWGVKGGLGYQWNNVGFELSYSFGIPDHRTVFEVGSAQRNQFYQASFRYLFELKGKKKRPSLR